MRTEDGYIIHKCLGGDPDAFGLLVDKYKASIYSLAYYKLGNFHDAEELTQEVFIKAYQKLRTLKCYDSFLAWLYAITANFCRNWIQSRARQPRHESIEDNGPEILDSLSMHSYRNRVADESLSDSLHEALDSLSEIHRQVLTLHYLGGMSTNEMARFLGTSPNTIMQRLYRARAKLRQEMITMMSRTFEQRRLQSSFTFRIMKAVKKMKIQPMPRTTGLPWGLSLATGIMITFLILTPQPGMFSRVATPSGSPLHVEDRIMKYGEIPVEVLEVPQISILSSKRGDGDIVGSELPRPQTPAFATANPEDDTWIYESASDKDVIADPKTGLEYTKIRTLTGRKDIVTWSTLGLNLSPNGKFLLWNKTVIPLDDGEPFDLVEMPARDGFWSPDGKKVVFYSGEGIWTIPVSPETGRSTGPAKKLLDGKHWHVRGCWSPDSERIVLEMMDQEVSGSIGILSIKDGIVNQLTNDPIREWRPIWSPDGKIIAYNRGHELRVISAEGGLSRKICDRGLPSPFFWSPDSEWLVYLLGGELRFFRLSDGRDFGITPPWKAVGKVGNLFGWSPKGKMLFYRPSYERKAAIKMVPASGGQYSEIGEKIRRWWQYTQSWSPDSKMIATLGENESCNGGLWVVPLTEGEPFLMELDVSSFAGELRHLYLSPDCRKLAFVVGRSDGKEDVYVIPVSLRDGRTTGPAVLIFDGWDKKNNYHRAFSWSPDGEKIALSHKWKMWIAFADGREPIQIRDEDPAESEVLPEWSPDGKMISYKAYHTEKRQILRVIRASGNYNTIVLDAPLTSGQSVYEWSPDSKELLLFSQRVISAVSIPDGGSRQLLDLKELSIDSVLDFSWSPDGRKFAFIGHKEEEESYHIFTTPAGGSTLTELAADDHNQKWFLYWSPDGKWISYDSYGYVKTRPEGAIWEVDVSGFLSGLESE